MKIMIFLLYCIILITHSPAFASENDRIHKTYQLLLNYSSECNSSGIKFKCTIDNVKFSENGQYFLASGKDLPAVVWQTEDLSLLKKIDNKSIKGNKTNYVTGADFFRGTESVFIGTREGVADNIDFKTGKSNLYRFDTGKSEGMLLSPSGNYLALGACLLDIKNNTIKRSSDYSVLTGQAFTDNERYLILSDFWFGAVHVIDTQTGNVFREWRTNNKYLSWLTDQRVSCIAIAPDSDTVAVGLNNGTMILFSIKSGNRIDDWDIGETIRFMKFSPYGKQLICSTGEKIVFWDNRKHQVQKEERTPDNLFLMDIRYDDNLIVFVSDLGQLILKTVDSQKTLFNETLSNNMITDFDIIPSKNLVLICDKNWEVKLFKINMNH